MNAFTFILRKNNQNSHNKLIVTKFIIHTLPMLNNKEFLDFINDFKTQKKKELQTHKNIYTFQQGVQNEKFFIKNTEVIKFLISFYPM